MTELDPKAAGWRARLMACVHQPNPTDRSRWDIAPGKHRAFQALIAEIAALPSEGPVAGSEPVWRNEAKAVTTIRRLREIIQRAIDKEPGYQTDREIYGQMHGQVMQLLGCDPEPASPIPHPESEGEKPRRGDEVDG